jgi:exonuclease VII small subunit
VGSRFSVLLEPAAALPAREAAGPRSEATTTSTTTTTIPPPECAAVPIAPRFASLACRVAALLARMKEETGLGVFQPKLIHSVEKAQASLDDAAMLCATSAKVTKKAKKRLQQAAKAVSQCVHRLSGLAARKKLDEVLREQLIDAATPIGADMKTLRGTLDCPADAAAIMDARAVGAGAVLARLQRPPRRA